MKLQQDDLCVACGDYAGEGRWICLKCEESIGEVEETELEKNNKNQVRLAQD